MEILFFIIIAGILSSIFGKGKTNKQDQRRNKPISFETFEEIKTFMQNETNKRTKPVQSEAQHPQPSNPELINRQRVKHKVQVHMQEQENQNLQKEGVEALPRVKEHRYIETAEEKSFLQEEPDASMIINGIVWAEILGEPRSKNPHFTRKR